jgi:hypothetical protein
MAQSGRLPNLIIIGAMKCGTTSLHYYLSRHPQVMMSQPKELDFFAQELNWSKGLDWYTSHFTGVASIYGEASPNYTNYPFWGGVPERIAAIIPEVKLIYLVRDPIERAISHYIHAVDAGREQRSFAKAVTDTHEHGYFRRGLYYLQLEQYLSCFSRSQILLIAQEELHAERQKTLEMIFRFLGVDPTFSSEEFRRLRHLSRDKRRKTSLGRQLTRVPFLERLRVQSPELWWHFERLLLRPLTRRIERPQVSADLRRKLTAYFRDDSRHLQEYAGRVFPGWSVES